MSLVREFFQTAKRVVGSLFQKIPKKLSYLIAGIDEDDQETNYPINVANWPPAQKPGSPQDADLTTETVGNNPINVANWDPQKAKAAKRSARRKGFWRKALKLAGKALGAPFNLAVGVNSLATNAVEAIGTAAVLLLGGAALLAAGAAVFLVISVALAAYVAPPLALGITAGIFAVGIAATIAETKKNINDPNFHYAPPSQPTGRHSRQPRPLNNDFNQQAAQQPQRGTQADTQQPLYNQDPQSNSGQTPYSPSNYYAWDYRF